MHILRSLFTSPIKWYKVFDSAQEAEKTIPLNKAITILVENKRICLARTLKGYFAVDDACPHLGESLSKGICNGLNEIVCPWHSYRFDLTLGSESTGHGLSVNTYPVEMRKDGLYVGNTTR